MNQPPEHFLRGSSLRCALVGLLLSAVASVAQAASTASPTPVLLWPTNASGGADADKPALLPFLPASTATGAAMVIVPSDPAGANVATGEAVQLARWLNERGIAGFVLRRRSAAADAVTDVNRAVQHLRANAASLKISPKRIAVLGFAGGAELAAEAVYNRAFEAKADAADPVEKVSSRPDLLALVWGAGLPTAAPAGAPPTFIVGSTNAGDNMTNTIELWNKLRAARVSVDAHFFAKADAKAGLGGDHPSLSTWPDLLYRWARFNSWLTDEPRLPVKGMVYLDGKTLPHGYVVFTPIDFVGAGPVVGRVLNSTSGQPLGLFTIPKDQGPIAGRYKIEVRQTMNRWLSNSFSGPLVSGRGPATPEKTYFGHHRVLSPSIGDERSFTKSRPSDRDELMVEFKAGAENPAELKIELFSK